MTMKNKVIIFSAPSGAGKSTIVNHLLRIRPELEFSISATSRAPRGQEQHGVEYYFFSADEFRKMISEDRFVEYEEVYEGSFYGTLKSEVERIWAKGNTIIFDIDVRRKGIFDLHPGSVGGNPPGQTRETRNRYGRSHRQKSCQGCFRDGVCSR